MFLPPGTLLVDVRAVKHHTGAPGLLLALAPIRFVKRTKQTMNLLGKKGGNGAIRITICKNNVQTQRMSQGPKRWTLMHRGLSSHLAPHPPSPPSPPQRCHTTFGPGVYRLTVSNDESCKAAHRSDSLDGRTCVRLDEIFKHCRASPCGPEDCEHEQAGPLDQAGLGAAPWPAAKKHRQRSMKKK